MNNRSSDIQSRLEQLHRDYARQLPEKVAVIEQAWRDVYEKPDSGALQPLIRLCHTLAGSGSSYGFIQITEYCRQLEQQLRVLEEKGTPLDEGLVGQIEYSLKQLRAAIQSLNNNPLERTVSPAEEGYNLD